MTTLTGKQRRYLRSLAHHLDPVVQVGRAGVTEAVVAQLDSALTTHELIKVKLGQEAPVDSQEATALIEQATGADVVQRIGRTLVTYRPHPEEPVITLPPASS